MKILKLFIAMFLVLTTAACSSGGSGGDSGSNKLVVYTPNSEGLINAVIPAFEEKYGITIELIQAGSGELFKRLQSEKSAPVADVIWGGTYTIYAQNLDLFEEYVSENNDGVIEEFRNSNGYTTPYTLDGSVIIVNRNLTEGMNISSYADLLNPELKGKIASADPSNSSSAFAQLTNMLLAMGGYESDKAWQFVDDLFTNIDGRITASSSTVYKSVADGEMAVGLSYEDPVVKLMNDGADVDIIYPKEGAVFLAAESAIIKGANNLENAQKFIDFIISQEIQEVLGTTTTNRPVRDDVKMNEDMISISKINTITEDYDFVMNNREKIVSRYNDIFVAIQSR